ncbi:hypothetical protein SFRURICE_008796 [Spodoptera frugiperda]|nr:hypothetical protein SFRURICE_008796 [Spodoptera frugiperda]
MLQDHSKQLLEHLTESEKIFLFGANPSEAQFEVAHLKQPKRRKRSLLYDDQDLVGLKKHLDIKLSPRNSFLDPQFLLMRRWSNNTELVLDQHADEEVDSCYYRGDNAALYVCDDVRGLVRSNDTYYFIHPLPDRFHDDHAKAHVIVKKQMNENKDDDDSCIERDNIIDDPQPANTWKKHRRKREAPSNVNNNLEGFKINLAHRNKTITDFIQKLSNGAPRQRRAILPAVFVETAVFVDRDLYKHMTINFPKDTERELVRFVLAMINAVQLIYHDPSLGRPVNFILKRLEILHEDPANLKRPHDIDRFLSNFCTWQRLENPPGDNDPLHWDHALILTGLDLYVVNKNGKVSSQVVGLAPVAGMCTVTSSCTVNEGRHFESVYVVAHEIGHNLGMRHDGPLADNGCDPSAYIMSPTLGSGKITWSQCSKNYLQKFLDTVQSRCLLDHGNSAGQLDHSAEGILPGERFDADQQCMLKYGRGSRHSGAQSLEDICRDLHCQRERYTWTSHPALEGTRCGEDMYCRGGECVEREGSTVVRGAWGRWSSWSECASACLVDDTHAPAAAGVAVATRRCNRARHEKNHCVGHDKKYQSCHAQQCSNVPRMTVREFADQICLRARDVDPDLIGTGLQRIDSDVARLGAARRHRLLHRRAHVLHQRRLPGNIGLLLLNVVQVARLGAARRHRLLHRRAHVLHQRRLPGNIGLFLLNGTKSPLALPNGTACIHRRAHVCISGVCQSRGWALPDGTACSTAAPMFCISGVCQSRGWALPDGTACSTAAPMFCISGVCQSRGWALPDGTACSTAAPMFCISGVCQVTSDCFFLNVVQVARLGAARRHRLLHRRAHVLHQRRLPGNTRLFLFKRGTSRAPGTLPDSTALLHRRAHVLHQRRLPGNTRLFLFKRGTSRAGCGPCPDGHRLSSTAAPMFCISGVCQVTPDCFFLNVVQVARLGAARRPPPAPPPAPMFCISGVCQSRGWALPDGTACSTAAPMFCISGVCQSRGWALPDGTACSTAAPMFCISGVCQSRGWALPDGTACSTAAPMFCISGVCQSRGWALPDGTACSTAAPMFCISGVCQEPSGVCQLTSDCSFKRVQVARLGAARRHRLLHRRAHVLHQRRLPGNTRLFLFKRGTSRRGLGRCPTAPPALTAAPMFCISGVCQSRGWALPDGTACSTAAPMFCISGVCQKFTCSSNPDTEFSLKPSDCEWEALRTATPPTTSTKTSGTWRRAVGGQWRPASGCHYHCISPGAGVRLVTATSRDRPLTSIQLCSPDSRPESGCTQRKSPYQYATMVCTKYKDRVRRLSGLGMQISPALEDPDRPCRIACQDERVSHRFYLVNGHEGWFPLGTSCGKRNASYCVSGKCLEFGPDNTPVSEMVFTLPLLGRGSNASVSWRTSRSVRTSRHRRRRSLGAQRITVKATLDQTHLDDIIARLNLTHNLNDHITYFDTIPEHIELDFNNPIHIAPEDTLLRKKPRPTNAIISPQEMYETSLCKKKSLRE